MIVFESKTPELEDFYILDPAVESVTWQGRKALRLSGQGACLALLPQLSLSHGRIEADIASEGTAYPGIAFRVLDTHNYELAYAQPHTSGKWDALQYDPVFHGSNTWQMYHGPGAQQTVQVPLQTWFRLRIEFQGEQAMIRVDEQSPLLVSRLAHDHPAGLVGLWTYLPAYFCNLRVWDDLPDWSSISFPPLPAEQAPGTLTEWFLEGYGKVTCESSGILNLNRYLPVTVQETRLIRQVEVLESGSFTFDLGFSDDLILQVDDQVIFMGQNTFHDSPHWSERGYVSLEQQVRCTLPSGVHRITAVLKATEYFGFGMALRISGGAFNLLPVYRV